MRSRAAFISSFGTTGILVAAALLMLALVSALVAFRGWPGGVEDSVSAVPINQQSQTPVELTQVREVAAPRTAVKRVATPARRSTVVRPRGSTTGLVKEVIITRPASPSIVKVPPGIRMDPDPGRAPTGPAQPPQVAPLADPPADPERPTLPVPSTELPPGTSPGELDDALDGLAEGLPGDSTSGIDVVVAPDGRELGVVIGDTSVALRLR
jgi:hypothetical protein